MSLSRIFLLVIALLAVSGTAVVAAPDIRVVGLFKDRAVVTIDGRQRILRIGETSPEGVRLISADSESALLEVDGKEIRGILDSRVSARNRSPEMQSVQIIRNNRGMYTTVGSINGLPVAFLVDTGATQVAMNSAAARRLGIDYRIVGTPAAVTTASGVERAWFVSLDSVKVGDILLQDVAGVVLEGEQPGQVLLGMSYLGRLEITNNGRLMTLHKKY
ncbi:MAG: TIGR02281 family clan AA aspartic protease [Gammaproteobacteria bacterium]|nr:TIGR02281 family clan AA aspartic protease [Gammaproteobacteria bacterium]